MSNPSDSVPWYRQFWLCFLIALPLVVVIACFYTVFLAIDNPLSIVKDDYYKEGLAINQNNVPYQHAKMLGLQAELRLLPDHSLQANVLSPAASLILPARLELHIAHPLNHERDMSLVLLQRSGVYVSEISNSEHWNLLQSEKRWYLTLRSLDLKEGEWAMRAEGAMSLTQPLPLDSSRE